MSFDTLAFMKRLSDAGMDIRHAEALAGALNDIAFDSLATRNDLRELELRISASMKELELRLTNSLTGRTGAMIGGSMALTIAILGALITLS